MAKYIGNKEFVNDKLTFQPTTLDSTERFSIWSVPEKKFYQEGQKITIDGKEYEVNKYIKLTEEQKKIYNRSPKAIRTVIFNGEECILPLSMTVEKELQKKFSDLEKLGNNPLEFTYTVVRNKIGDRPIDIRYELVLGEKVGMGTTKPAAKELSLDLDEDVSDEEKLSEDDLSEIETKYINAIKTKYPEFANRAKYSVDELANTLVKGTKIAKSRATQIVNTFLS